MNSLNHQKICVEFHVLNRHCTRYSTCPQLEHLLTSTTAANTCWYEHKIMFLFTFPRGLFHFFVHGSGLCTWILTWFTSHTCAAHFNRETSAYLQSGLGFRSNFLQPTRELFLYLLIYLFIYLSILHPIALVLFLIPFDFKSILIASLAVEIYVGQIYLRRGLFCKGRFMQIC